MLWLLSNNHTWALCSKMQNGWKWQQSDFQHRSNLTSTQVYIRCRYWRCCTSYSSLGISCKCWSLKNTWAAGYTRRLIESRSGDAFEIKMGQRSRTMMKNRQKGESESGSPVGEEQEGEEEKWARDGADEQSRRTKGHKEEMVKEMERVIS